MRVASFFKKNQKVAALLHENSDIEVFVERNFMNHVKIGNGSLTSKLNAVDEEFKDFLSGLAFKREFSHDKLKTFSPLDAVEDFELRGLSRVQEPGRDEMMTNEKGFNKLLANMLAQCQPGSLSDEDLIQITGINGREIHA